MKVAKIISAIAVAMCSFAVTMTINAAEATEFPRSLVNGSFDIPVVPSISNYDGDLSSGTKGSWYLNTNEGFEERAIAQGYPSFGWRTTAYDEKIELVSQKRSATTGYNVVPYEGDQFAELIAEEQSSLYQTVSTPVVGEVFNWSLAHAGRAERDTMGLFIGPAQADYMKVDSWDNDIFMWMAELIKNTSQIEWEKADVGCTKHTVYSRKDIDLSKVTEKNYTNYFSFTKTDEINQEWQCWLITDDAGAWGVYSGSYTIPENQPATTFAFTAITGHDNYSALGRYNEGNLLDAIKFSTSYPLRATTTQGGSGTVTVDGTKIGDIIYNSDYANVFEAGTEVIITATPAAGYNLVGMYINGTFCTTEETEDHFTHLGNGVYSHTVTVDTARYIQLIFSKKSTVIYDPNGGTFMGTTENTEVTMAPYTNMTENKYFSWKNTEDALPLDDKTRFIGWYVGRIIHNGTPGGALIASNHTINYNPGSTIGVYSDDTIDLYYSLVVRGGSGSQKFALNDGIVLMAEWEYLQETAVKTKPMEDAHYFDDSTGGYVTQTIEDIDSDVLRPDAYGRMRDVVTLTATANDGFRFRGWYDSQGNLLSDNSTYEYEVSDSTMVYAYFSELHHPIVAFVSATGNELLEGQGTHTIYCATGENPPSALTGKGGENLYGSTISTAFVTRQLLNTNHPYAYTQWSITLPAPTAQNPIYIKSEDATSSSFVFNKTPVIRDAAGVQVNKGNIYKVTAFGNGADFITIHLFNILYNPVILTTEGEVEYIYGITLDNIYAPGATATLDLKTSFSDMLFESVDLTVDDGRFVRSETLDEYLTDEDNKYSKVTTEAK